MPVVVTRPAPEAGRWVELLERRGIEALALPLLAIAPAPDTQALQRAAARAGDYGAVMFVSANAVNAFFAAAPAFASPRAWAPGPATREALLAAGLAPDRIDAPPAEAPQFDSEQLWQVVQGQLGAGDRLLLVRGGDAQGRSQGRDWIAAQLAAAGVEVHTVVAYVRRVPAWSAVQREMARRASGHGATWLFSSSEATANLQQLLPGQDWSRACALATHPRIAEAVRAVGFGQVRSCQPGLDAVVASIESQR
jgi:uroporphyrinogen-III synthase